MNAVPAEARLPPATAPHKKIYPQAVAGRFQRLRLFTSALLQAILFGGPWLEWHGRQAILLDVARRRFYCFGLTFWPQEMYFVLIMLISAAVVLFVATAVGGRLWCGYACPQTVMTGAFMRVESWLEGGPVARRQLDRAPWTGDKWLKKVVKYGVWALMAGWLGITFVGYFTPIRSMLADFAHRQFDMALVGPVMFFSAAAFFDLGYFREQLCHYVCPYARFQGAMFDSDTLIVGYDAGRGEPRGKVSKPDAGSCVDCRLCVQVCPMGIDIRQGLQMECIACTACIDACDHIMDQVGRPRGLIRYSSLNALRGGKTRWLRPRILVYVMLLASLVDIFGTLMMKRQVVDMDVVRGVSDNVFARTPDGRVSNVYQLKLMNRDGVAHHLQLAIQGLANAELVTSGNPVEVPTDAAIDLRVMVVSGADHLAPVSTLDFLATDIDKPSVVLIRHSSFVGPGL